MNHNIIGVLIGLKAAIASTVSTTSKLMELYVSILLPRTVVDVDVVDSRTVGEAALE